MDNRWSPSRMLIQVLDPFTSTVKLVLRYPPEYRKVLNTWEFFPSEVASQPSVRIKEAPPNALFTLVMVDPDAPSPADPYLGEHLHWMVINIPARTSEQASQGMEVVVEYEPPEPQPNQGIHKYVFVVFKQRQRIAHMEPPTSRYYFSTRIFAAFYDLDPPSDAVYFYARSQTACRSRRRYN